MQQIPYFDLKAQYQSIQPQIIEAISRVLNKQAFIQGEEVAQFEKEWAKYCGTDYCVCVNSGTSALHLALLAHGIGKGDEVITVLNTFIATAEAIAYTGAKPVFVDVNESTFNIDVDKIESAITERTKAIIPVHLYGLPCDIDRINYIAYKHGLVVIEDACQAHGAEYKGFKVGSIGDCGCFSFYPSKIIGTYGEGGCITTDNEEIYYRIKQYRDHGQSFKNHHMVIGYNYRMSELQAAVLRVKLKYIDEWITKRIDKTRIYDSCLLTGNLYKPRYVEFSAPYVYVIRVKNRDTVQAKLTEKGIGTAIHYLIPIHLQPAFAYLGYKKGDFPIAEQLADEILSLPLYPELEDSSIEYVCDCLTEVLR